MDIRRPPAIKRQGGTATEKEEKRIKIQQKTAKKKLIEKIANFRQSTKKYPDGIGGKHIITERKKEMKEVTRKMVDTIRETEKNALQKYTPVAFCDHLKRDGGNVICDKTQMVEEKSDEWLFGCVLHRIYGWDYTTMFDNVTIYFDFGENRVLYGGVYNEVSHKKITRRAIASERGNGTTTLYTYDSEIIDRMIERLKSTINGCVPV